MRKSPPKKLNRITLRDDYAIIHLTNTGNECLVDLADLVLVHHYTWCKNDTGYAVTGVWNTEKQCSGGVIRLHHMIISLNGGLVVDHINGNKLDNRRKNLRLCLRRENMMNQQKQKGRSSQYKGVSWCKSRQKWEAYITVNQKKINLGRYDNAKEAAHIYDVAALKHYGEFAKTNKDLGLL